MAEGNKWTNCATAYKACAAPELYPVDDRRREPEEADATAKLMADKEDSIRSLADDHASAMFETEGESAYGRED